MSLGTEKWKCDMRVSMDFFLMKLGVGIYQKCSQGLLNQYPLSVTWPNEIYKMTNFLKYLYKDLLKFLGDF